MKKLIYLLACAGLLIIQSCGQRSENSTDVSDTTMTDTTITSDIGPAKTGISDTGFTTKAAIGGMAEVGFGKLALQKGNSAIVKEFAAMMVKDHGKANEELKEIATAKGIVLPESLDAEHLAVQKELQAARAAEFDIAYVKAMVEGHQKTLALMEDGSRSLSDPELKAFADKTAPIVKHHLDLIEKIQTEMKL